MNKNEDSFYDDSKYIFEKELLEINKKVEDVYKKAFDLLEIQREFNYE